MKKILFLLAFLSWGGVEKTALAAEECTSSTGGRIGYVGESCTTGSGLMGEEKCSDTSAGCTIIKCSGSCYCGTSCPGGTGGNDRDPNQSCPSNCPSDKIWLYASDLLDGELNYSYQLKCDSSSSIYKCVARCAPGYYGTASASAGGFYRGGCTACPPHEDSTTVFDKDPTSAGGATTEEECYIPSGASFTDNIGKGSLPSLCYYSN